MGAPDAGSRGTETRPPYFNGRELRTESIWGAKSGEKWPTDLNAFRDFLWFFTIFDPRASTFDVSKTLRMPAKKKKLLAWPTFLEVKIAVSRVKISYAVILFSLLPERNYRFSESAPDWPEKVYRERGCNPTFPAPVFRMTWVAQGKLPQININIYNGRSLKI